MQQTGSFGSYHYKGVKDQQLSTIQNSMATYMKGLLLQSLIIRNNLSTIIVLKKEQQGGFKKEPNFGH